jgi:hypothetical protein
MEEVMEISAEGVTLEEEVVSTTATEVVAASAATETEVVA